MTTSKHNTSLPSSMHTYPDTVVQRFWSCVDKTDTCWLWTGTTRDTFGYGALSVNSAFIMAHRLSYELHVGPIPNGLFVLHRCDVPPCVRPDHLFLGTQLDNIRDMIQKNRQHYAQGDNNGARTRPDRLARGSRHGTHTHPESVPHGSQHSQAKLTEESVHIIFQRFQDGQGKRGIKAQLAREFGVDPRIIGDILQGKRWKHVSQRQVQRR
jgi:HNH endonuclease